MSKDELKYVDRISVPGVLVKAFHSLYADKKKFNKSEINKWIKYLLDIYTVILYWCKNSFSFDSQQKSKEAKWNWNQISVA